MERNAENTTQRDWHTLKPGDVIWFANGWFEVFDAYAVGHDIVKVKLIVDGHVEALQRPHHQRPGHLPSLTQKGA